MKSCFNVGLKLSRDFQTITAEFVNEEIEYENEEEMKAKLREKFHGVFQEYPGLLRDFKKIAGDRLI